MISYTAEVNYIKVELPCIFGALVSLYRLSYRTNGNLRRISSLSNPQNIFRPLESCPSQRFVVLRSYCRTIPRETWRENFRDILYNLVAWGDYTQSALLFGKHIDIRLYGKVIISKFLISAFNWNLYQLQNFIEVLFKRLIVITRPLQEWHSKENWRKPLINGTSSYHRCDHSESVWFWNRISCTTELLYMQ